MLIVSALASPQWQAGYYEALQQANNAIQRGNVAAGRLGGGPVVVPAQAGSPGPSGSGLPTGFVAPIPGSGACTWTCPTGDAQYYVPCAQTQLCGGPCDPRVCANSKEPAVNCLYLQQQLPPENC